MNIVEHDQTYFDDDTTSADEEAQAKLDDIHRVCKGELELAAGYDEDELVDNRKKALDYYFGRPRGDELEGRSEAQSMDVADMVEATLAEVMPLYANPQLATFGALNGQDVNQAKIESKYCNHAFMELNDGWTVLYKAVKDALLQRNAILDIYVHETKKPKFESYQGLIDTELLALTSQSDTEVVDFAERTSYDEIIGEFPIYDVTIRTYEKCKKLIAENVAPEDFYYTVNTHSTNPADMLFNGRRILTTKGALIAEGYDPEVVKDLKEYDGTTSTDEEARNILSDEGEYEGYAQEYVEIFKCFIMYDYDGDGIAELHKVIMTEDEVIDRSWVEFCTFASGSPFLMPHRFTGMSMFDKLEGTQDQKTKFLRQWLDNADHMNNRRLEVVENQVRIEDVLNSRPGGVVRTKSRGVVNPIPVDDIGPSCQNALNYLDSVRSERGGASLDMQTQAMTIGAETAHGVERQYSSKEKIAALIARTLAETLIRQCYVLVHANLRTFMSGPQDFEYADQWIQTDPSKWLKRNVIKIDVGMSIGERTAKVATLRGMLDLQIKALELKSEDVLVNLEKVYDLIMDIGYASGLQNPERYWIDPRSEQSKKALQGKMAAAKQASDEAKQMQRMIFEYQRHIEAQKDKIDMYKVESENLNKMKDRLTKVQQHNDKLIKEYTELELQYNTDIKGEGQGE